MVRRRRNGRLRSDSVRGDIEADPEQAARTIALNALSRQPRTRSELVGILRRRGVPDEPAERVLGRLEDVRLIDDEAYANAWVETRHAGRGLARRALADELRRRGVDDELIGAATDQIDRDTELATARALVQRRLATTERLDPQTRLRRLVGLLARKGYSSAVAVRVVREALEDEDAEGAARLLDAAALDLDSVPDDEP